MFEIHSMHDFCYVLLPEGAVKFGFYEVFVASLEVQLQRLDDPTKISGWARFASGGLGGVAAQYVSFSESRVLRFTAMPTDKISSNSQLIRSTLSGSACNANS